jgi:hypothetical protein
MLFTSLIYTSSQLVAAVFEMRQRLEVLLYPLNAEFAELES